MQLGAVQLRERQVGTLQRPSHMFHFNGERFLGPH